MPTHDAHQSDIRQEAAAKAHANELDQVVQAFDVDPRQGLSRSEAERRLEQFGSNTLRETKTRSAWWIFLDQFKSMVIIVLVIAGCIAFTFQHWAEGLAIAAVLLVNAGIGFFTEYKAIRSMEALRAMGGDTIRIRRDGVEQELDAELLVPGDILIFEVGVLCSNASLQDLDNDDIPDEEQGDPTETALLRSGHIFGLERSRLLREKPEEKEVPFDPEQMMMATYHRSDQGLEIAVKGAPSRVLDVCERFVQDFEGTEASLRNPNRS